MSELPTKLLYVEFTDMRPINEKGAYIELVKWMVGATAQVEELPEFEDRQILLFLNKESFP